MNMRLTLDALIILDTIDKRGSFAAAADELARVPSALTYAVQKLESDLKVKLFDRSGHKAKLTTAGRLLLEQGRHILRLACETERLVQQVESGWETELRIAYSAILNIANFLPLLEEFYKECPHVRVIISSEILNGGWDALHSGRADLAIGVTGNPPEAAEFGLQSLGKIEFVFAVAKHHPLAKLKGVLNNLDISKYRGVAVADTTRELPAQTAGLLVGQDVLTVANFDAKIKAQIAGLGIGHIPKTLLNKTITKQLVIKKVKNAKPSAALVFAWNLQREGKALQWFINKLQDTKIKKELLS